MARDDGPNLSMSFLDLLLSALGGVALLVMLFAATRAQKAEDASASSPRHLVISVTKGPPGVLVGRELGLAIEHAGELVYMAPGQEVAESKLAVKWPAEARRLSYTLRVRPKSDAPVKVHVWLKQLTGAEVMLTANEIQQLRSVLAGAVEIQVHWSDRQESATSGALSRSNGFISAVVMP